MAKPFKTYEDLLIFLQDEKNLTIENMDAATHILLKTSYFSLIPGYNNILKTRHPIYACCHSKQLGAVQDGLCCGPSWQHGSFLAE